MSDVAIERVHARQYPAKSRRITRPSSAERNFDRTEREWAIGIWIKEQNFLPGQNLKIGWKREGVVQEDKTKGEFVSLRKKRGDRRSGGVFAISVRFEGTSGEEEIKVRNIGFISYDGGAYPPPGASDTIG